LNLIQAHYFCPRTCFLDKFWMRISVNYFKDLNVEWIEGGNYRRTILRLRFLLRICQVCYFDYNHLPLKFNHLLQGCPAFPAFFLIVNSSPSYFIIFSNSFHPLLLLYSQLFIPFLLVIFTLAFLLLYLILILLFKFLRLYLQLSFLHHYFIPLNLILRFNYFINFNLHFLHFVFQLIHLNQYFQHFLLFINYLIDLKIYLYFQFYY
jgi:hypothetical protein